MTFTAINPANKLIFAHFSGKRITENAIKFLQIIRKRLKTLILYITTDAADMYESAISSVFGKLSPDKLTCIFPEKFVYAQVVKSFEKGKVGKVEKRIIIGGQDLVDECLNASEVSFQINTAFVERANLTLRQHSHRVERKTQGYSKLPEYFKWHLILVIAYYNFHPSGTGVYLIPA